jgi:uncharacterized protein (TIGR02466 family)
MSELDVVKLDYCFPSPVMRHVWADCAGLNKELRRHILAHERESRGQAKSNIGGWHSETGLLEWCGDAGKTLVGRMVEMANHATTEVMLAQGIKPTEFGWTLQAWANVSRTADFNKTHTHPGATWSGTYYVDAGDSSGDPEKSTLLQLFDPCQGRTSTFFPGLLRPSIFVHPVPGLMILFPSYIPHTVFSHRGDRARISIAFNLRKEPYP